MTQQSDQQWPDPQRPRPVAPASAGLVQRLTRDRLVIPLFIHYKFGMCLALIGSPMIALLLYALSPSVYRAQTNVIVTTSLEHQARSDGEIETTSQIPRQEFVNAEADLLSNPIIVEQTLAHFEIAELYPDFLKLQAGSQIMKDAAIRQFQLSLRVVPIQQSGVIRLTFDHSNATTAMRALNQFVLSYQNSRTKILEGRNSRTTKATILHNLKDLEQLERAREEVRIKIGIPDPEQQRAVLVRQRTDTDTRLRQTVERIQALSIRLADLAQTRAKMVADTSSSQTDNRARTSHARNVTVEQNPVRAATAQAKDQIVVVQDQSAGAGAVTAKLSSGQSLIQLAPRLLNQFMTRKQGVPVKVTAGTGLATHEARIAQALRDLDSLEQRHVVPKPVLHVTASGRPPLAQLADMSEQPLQPESDTGGSRTQTIVLALPATSSGATLLSTFTGTAPATIAAPEVWDNLHWQQLVVPLGDNQNDPLIQRLQPRFPAVQQQIGGTLVTPAKLPVTPLSTATAIDRDRFSAETELDALRTRQTIDTVSIGLIDQQLVRLGQADLRLNLLNARIADQHERVTAAQKLYDNAKAAEDGDQVGIGDVVQTSSEAISVSSVRPGTSVFGSVLFSLFLAATILVITRISGRRSMARNRPLELFLNTPRSETG